MTRTPEAQALYSVESERVKDEIGYPSNSQTSTPEQRAEYVRMMAAFIIRNAHAFSVEEVERAYQQSDFYAAPEALSSGFSTFFDEFGNQGNRLNPFSEQNRNKTALYIVGGVVALGAIIILANKIK